MAAEGLADMKRYLARGYGLVFWGVVMHATSTRSKSSARSLVLPCTCEMLIRCCSVAVGCPCWPVCMYGTCWVGDITHTHTHSTEYVVVMLCYVRLELRNIVSRYILMS